jgi:two-component system, LytTR family, response regulator
MMRALIVEDAPLLRRGIRLYLQGEQDIEVVGEACDGPDAVAHIDALHPDIVFLDIQLPGFDGFEVLARAQVTPDQCAIIFITAYADYALRAFDSNALSYLLKPFERRRFTEVVHRARLFLSAVDRCVATRDEPGGIEPVPVMDAVVSAHLNRHRRLTRLLVRQADRFLLLKASDIDWIAATGEYATIHTMRGSWLLRTSVTELAARLDAEQFVRIHRSTIVNLDRVAEIQPRSHGNCDVIMQDGRLLRVSRSHRDSLFAKGT